MASEFIEDDEGGESACYAHLLCRECGAVLGGSSHHCVERADDPDVDPESDPDH